MDLDLRKLKVLTSIVESYIKTGEPVGSKAICAMLDIPVSSATIRNDMAALAEMGLIEQPHTSAGRIPSQKGYRLYVDRLMNKKELSPHDKQMIRSFFETKAADVAGLIEHASKGLADLTGCASVSTTPTPQFAHIRRIEAVFAGRKTVVLILITSSGIIKNKVCRLDFDMDASQMEVLSNFLNEHFVGIPLENITPALIQTLAVKLSAISLTLTPILFSVYELYKEVFEGEVVLQGQSNLLPYVGTGSLAFRLMEFLSNPSEISGLLSRSKEPVSVLIGDETQTPVLSDSSVIVVKYHIGGVTDGKVGIIGPSRIDYARIIPALEYFADFVGLLLENNFDED